MTTLPMIGRIGRAATLALMLAAPAVSTSAYAFDPFGGDETVVLKSAQSARYADPADTPLARATAQVRLRASPLASNATGNASDAPLIGGFRDLLGQGAQQDELAREIYHPGSGTDW
jgi:hypothetical protein